MVQNFVYARAVNIYKCRVIKAFGSGPLISGPLISGLIILDVIFFIYLNTQCTIILLIFVTVPASAVGRRRARARSGGDSKWPAPRRASLPAPRRPPRSAARNLAAHSFVSLESRSVLVGRADQRQYVPVATPHKCFAKPTTWRLACTAGTRSSARCARSARSRVATPAPFTPPPRSLLSRLCRSAARSTTTTRLSAPPHHATPA